MKYKAAFVVMLVIAVGAWLRLYHISSWVWEMAGYDESRDMLVARHLVEQGDWLWRGPLAAGGQNILANSPFYYYFLALLWFFTRTPEMLMVAWVLVLLSMIPLAFYIGKRLWDTTTGVYMAVLISLHPTLIAMTKQISQPNLMPLWIMLSIAVVLGPKQSMWIWAIFSLSTIFLGLHIHYGSFIVIPVLLLWFFRLWWNFSPKWHKSFIILYPFFITELMLLVWIFSSYKYVPFDQFIFAQTNLEGVRQWWPAVVGAISATGTLVWPDINGNIAIGMLIFIVVVTLLGGFGKLRSSHLRQYYRWGLLGMVVPFVLVGLYKGQVSQSYLYSILPLYLIFLALGMRRLYSLNRFLGVLISLVVWAYMATQALQIRPPVQTSYYRLYKGVAESILKDYTTVEAVNTNGDDSIPSFILATLSTSGYLVYDGWGTGSTWYWLEELSRIKLVRLNSGTVNFFPLVTHPRYFYMICDHRDYGSIQELCLDRFKRVRPYISDTYQTVYQTSVYTVWRFQIVSEPINTYYNVAYEELLHPKSKQTPALRRGEF